MTLAQRLVESIPTGLPGLFNPWWERCPKDSANNGPGHRLARLEAHLDCEARWILVGEAPGYQGCRYSGIAFTSERIFPCLTPFFRHSPFRQEQRNCCKGSDGCRHVPLLHRICGKSKAPATRGQAIGSKWLVPIRHKWTDQDEPFKRSAFRGLPSHRGTQE